ncbi:MAG: hypothetical protein ACTS3F_00495 [Phycisphaerales bacterium]
MIEDRAIDELERSLETIRNASSIQAVPDGISTTCGQFPLYIAIAYETLEQRSGDHPETLERAMRESERIVERIARIAAEASFNDPASLEHHAQELDRSRRRTTPASPATVYFSVVLQELADRLVSLRFSDGERAFSQRLVDGFLRGMESAPVEPGGLVVRDGVIAHWRDIFDSIDPRTNTQPVDGEHTALQMQARRSQGGTILTMLDEDATRRLTALRAAAGDRARSVSGVLLAPCWGGADHERMRLELR